jgi:hypothetical protein
VPGLVPGIHVLAALKQKDVDGRDKPGHDEKDNLKHGGSRQNRPASIAGIEKAPAVSRGGSL